jgi:hypothetical protein
LHQVTCYEQEPPLDDSKTVIEIVREGVAETTVLEEFNQINDSFGSRSMKMQIRWTN